ncbi:hypothetical protein [Hypericibacter sp.]|uniref:hypothetical protein n=1 Tax=Hypericibacter sp. TaxID=2705401 RepID=UPI003D6CAEFC
MRPHQHGTHGHHPPPAITEVTHHVVARHQVEIEISPPRVELAFRDERFVNPINTQVRFEAKVYNSRRGASWEVLSPAGGPGAGSIDPQGLYRAPNKGGLASPFTDLVVATALEDPLRKAFAWVTVIGIGPEPAPTPVIEIWPKRATLYYAQGDHNAYIDDSNKMQLFEARLSHTAGTAIEWLVDGVLQAGTAPTFLYKMPNLGGTHLATVRARVQAQPGVSDDAKVLQLNYVWPGLL